VQHVKKALSNPYLKFLAITHSAFKVYCGGDKLHFTICLHPPNIYFVGRLLTKMLYAVCFPYSNPT